MVTDLIDLKALDDERGGLVAIEEFDVGFEIKRVYFIFGTQPEVIRGLHAHRELKQVAIALSGRCTFLLDDGRERQTVVLDDPHRGLPIKSMIWREMSDFSPDCVLLVLASEPYDEADYIRSYEEFREAITATPSDPCRATI